MSTTPCDDAALAQKFLNISRYLELSWQAIADMHRMSIDDVIALVEKHSEHIAAAAAEKAEDEDTAEETCFPKLRNSGPAGLPGRRRRGNTRWTRSGSAS
jgi:hypothetical protein